MIAATRHPRVRVSPASLGERLAKLFSYEGEIWLVNKVSYGHSEGACLFLAQSLKAILPGARVVTLNDWRDEPDHYGVLWRGWYFDGSGGHASGAAWIRLYDSKYKVRGARVHDRFVRAGYINGFEWAREDLMAYLREQLDLSLA